MRFLKRPYILKIGKSMLEVQCTSLVPYSPEQMFNLVNRIEEYPEFLLWCTKTEVTKRTETEVVGSITAHKAGITMTFSTVNLLIPGRKMNMRLVEGPFKYLEGDWDFIPLGEGKACKVNLHLKFEFINFLAEKTIRPLIEHIANTFIKGFIERAEKVYGTNSASTL